MSDNMAGRHFTVFSELPDNSSIMSSNAGEMVFPDIPVMYYVQGDPKLRAFKGKVDTGASLCLIAEKTVRERFGIERIDISNWKKLDDLGLNGTRTMGQIRLNVLLGPSQRYLSVAFEVVPDEYVDRRYDALLSDKLVKHEKILVLGPAFRVGEKDSGIVDEGMAKDLCRQCLAARA